jgi:6-phosphogluconolactonase/glucosamine-6-phosphate isomerase/deaminase
MSGGRTMAPFLKALGKVKTTPDDWRSWHLCEIDSFAPTSERPETNANVLMEGFFAAAVRDKVIPANRLHWFCPDHPRGFDAAIADYEAKVLEVSGTINICVFGCGGGVYFKGGPIDTGHCMGVFPGNSAAWSDDAPRFIHVDDAPKPPAVRMTASPRAVREADCAIGIISGLAKANTLAHFMNEDVRAVDCPAKILNEVKGSSYLFSDVELSVHSLAQGGVRQHFLLQGVRHRSGETFRHGVLGGGFRRSERHHADVSNL